MLFQEQRVSSAQARILGTQIVLGVHGLRFLSDQWRRFARLFPHCVRNGGLQSSTWRLQAFKVQGYYVWGTPLLSAVLHFSHIVGHLSNKNDEANDQRVRAIGLQTEQYADTGKDTEINVSYVPKSPI
jgi:hypothetical protein